MFLLWTCSNSSISGVTTCYSPQRLLWFFLLSSLLWKQLSPGLHWSPLSLFCCAKHRAQHFQLSTAFTALQPQAPRGTGLPRGSQPPLASTAMMHTLQVSWRGGSCMAVQSCTSFPLEIRGLNLSCHCWNDGIQEGQWLSRGARIAPIKILSYSAYSLKC